jgi:predicted small secreted protein
LVTIVEVAAGSLTDGSGPNNVFQLCLDGTATFTSPGPSAFVTGGTAAGNLILREGSGASPDNIVAGTVNGSCYYWTVWTKSTTATTIVIGSSATVGPLVNVNSNASQGPLNATLSAGSLASLTTQVSLVIANRVFATQVKVTAVSQPIMAPGSVHQLAGDILIEETGNGQLKNGEEICVEVVPNQNTGTLTDVFLSGQITADLPIATAANGVVIGSIQLSTDDCDLIAENLGSTTRSFSFFILQQSTTGTGKVTISNIHFSVLNDAVAGAVQVNVVGLGTGGNSIDFQRIVSNARVGSPIAGTAATRLGVTQVGAFTTSTKVTTKGKYVTYRFDFGVAAAGKAVQVWGATKTGNDWSAFAVVTTRTANASGVVYYYIRQNSATWKSYRAYWTGGGAWTPARQARWVN